MLYIMRHGQTQWNAQGRLQGQTDIPLNEVGRAGAAAAREKYGCIPLDVCFASPLKRALETAEIFLRGREVPIYTDDRLKEMFFGDFEGEYDVLKHPEYPIYPLFADPANYVPTGGTESYPELYARLEAFLREKVQPRLDKGENVLIVAHGAVNCCLLSIVRKTPLADIWKPFHPNCALIQAEE